MTDYDPIGNLEVATDYLALQRRELSERRAILTGQLHLTGSMVKALRHMRILETITAVTSEIPCKT